MSHICPHSVKPGHSCCRVGTLHYMSLYFKDILLTHYYTLTASRIHAEGPVYTTDVIMCACTVGTTVQVHVHVHWTLATSKCTANITVTST